MSKPLTAEEQLQIICKAWGKQRGYVFFPWIDGAAKDKGERIRSYHEGPAFKWPAEREEIVAHLEAHRKDDVYWCPSIFEKKARKLEFAMDEHALWADLDEVDPQEIDGYYKPTIAWETSPGRFQALWLLTAGDLQGASWPGNENQRLTYYIGADHSGWDTTQLLRIPGWRNHKPDYRDEETGRGPRGRLLWKNGPRYLADHFEDLPEVRGAGEASLAADVMEDAVSAVDRLEVWGKVRLKVSKEVRDLVAARDTAGRDRSDKLWQIERDLADAGLTVPEIVSIVRETVWNKFAGRNDELQRLVTEAAKAIGERSEETEQKIEKDREEKPRPSNLFTLVKEAEPPVWLVKGILTEGSVGFFAGEPKSFKSWCAMDLALSVATGTPFLDAFDVLEPGPVLYIQEEDPLPTLKDRLGKIAPHKTLDKVTVGDIGEDGLRELVWAPADENTAIPPIAAIVREQFVASDPGWQAWLDEVLEEGYGGSAEDDEGKANEGEPYKLVIIDTLGTTMGEVDENRASELNLKILTPLRQVAEKHGCALQVVHHLGKAREGDTRRSGQKLLGSVALHAWSESSLYFTHGSRGTMLVETESKHATTLRFEIRGLRKRTPTNALTWEPEVHFPEERDDADDKKQRRAPAEKRERTASGGTRAVRIGQGTRRMLARFLGLDPDIGQAELREAWELSGYEWGDWSPAGSKSRAGTDDAGNPKVARPKVEPDPPALKALRKLVAREPRGYTTHEVKDEMARELGTKPTQTIYLRAYQQLKKLYDEDKLRKVEKEWLLPDVTDADLIEAEIAEMI